MQSNYNGLLEIATYYSKIVYIYIYIYINRYIYILIKRETEERKREIEKRERKNKKWIKNNKERIFKWSVKKKKKSFDGRDIVKWCVIYYKISFWDGKC